jgi:DNA polymerase-3 subunit alpha
MSTWWNAHSHSHFSALDGMARVPDIVAKVARMGQPAVSLTDHGNMAGAVQLYQSARKHGVAPFIGVEAYLLDPQASLEDKNAKRYHIGLLALNLDGYRGLMGLVNTSHTRPRFNRFPRITLEDLIQLSEDAADDVVILTGCYFGLVQQTLVNQDERQAKNIVKMYAKLFPHTFVELQNHSICHDQDGEEDPFYDDDIVNQMVAMADELGLPMLATQDSHYLDQNDKIAHALMKRMVYGGVEDAFPGDAFHVPTAEWVAEHYDDDVWKKVEEGSAELLDLHALTIPPLEKFKAHVPQIVKNPSAVIGKLCREALADYEPAKRKRKVYEERLIYELGVINDLGMAGYFMIVRNYVEWCHQKKVCVEARGSANGSLVCFLLGITQVDPIKWGNLFDRFLSRDRIKPPDIDMDVEDVARPRLLGYLNRTFDTLQIGNWGGLGINDDGTGSVLQTYKTHIARQMPDKEQKSLVYTTIMHVDDVKALSKADYKGLVRLGKMDVYRSYGSHASGILLSGTDQKISDYVPHMLIASSDTHVSQFDKDDVEELGYLKLDVLGQVTLTVMRQCQEMIGIEDPTDFSWIPENDSAACKILREGRTDNGIFHFEGYTKAKGGKQMGIRTTMDAVLATGLFMPGAMNTGQTDLFLQRRKDRAEREKVKYIHPAFEAALKDTHGAVVFQEQVINIMRGLGMSLEGINTFFKVVKDSGSGATARNNERLSQVRDEFDELCRKAGIAEKDIDKAWESTAGFVEYGFNRAHATGYGLRSYRCAYLKAHYPLEFMTALLQANAGRKKEALYVREARRMGIRVLSPDVNISDVSWTLDMKAKAIRRGLLSIKGVGMAAAESLADNAPYESLDDLIERTDSRAVTGGKQYAKDGTLNGVLAKLDEIGALRSIRQQEEG